MTKFLCTARVVGQYMLNATTKQIDLIAPDIARTAVPGQFVNVQVSRHTAPLLRRQAAGAGVDTAMYQPAIATQKVDLVDIDVAVATELDGDRLGALFGGLRAQQREGIGQTVGEDFFAFGVGWCGFHQLLIIPLLGDGGA